MNKIIEIMEKEFPNYIIMFEKGSFCNVYYEDSYVISYLLDYKIKQLGTDVSCGFPKNSLNKVRSILENKKINYLVVDRSHSYEEDNKVDFKDNKYQEIYEKAKKYVTAKMRLENISRYILNNIEDEEVVKIIKKSEDLVNETRKVYSNKSC